MLSKKEYKENLIRMFDSLRDGHKGEENCIGVVCGDCPLYKKTCGSLFAFEAIEFVEKWAKEHPIKTNADKYKEVFGFELPLNRCIQNNVSCAYCEYYDAKVSICRADERFWNTEYKEPTKEGEE